MGGRREQREEGGEREREEREVGRGPEGENEGGCKGEKVSRAREGGIQVAGVCSRIVGYLSDCLNMLC